MSCEELKNVVCRLEKVADKLETISLKGRGGGDGDENSELVDGIKPLVDKTVAEFVATAKKIAPEVGDAATRLQKCFLNTVELMKLVATTKKPSDSQLAEALKPLGQSIEEVSTFVSNNFKSNFKSHLEAITNYTACFGWMTAPGKPQTHISNSIESGLFYANRVLTGFKDKGDEHKVFVQQLKKCFEELKEYTQEFHGNGCAWNMKGKEFSGGPAPAKAAPATSAPSPARPAASSGPAPTANLFAEINKGTGISSGLRKVDDSMKTHKNPNLRAGATVLDTDKPKSTPAASKSAPATVKPPTMELTGKKWILDNQLNNPNIQITDGDLSYTISVFNGKNSNIFVVPKMNSVSLENCQKCKVQLKAGLISFVELTNCKSVEIHADEVLPFVNINSCDNVIVYLNPKSQDCQISTNISTGVNVCFWGPEIELVEHPVPEMFVSFLKDGKLITEISKNV